MDEEQVEVPEFDPPLGLLEEDKRKEISDFTSIFKVKIFFKIDFFCKIDFVNKNFRYRMMIL